MTGLEMECGWFFFPYFRLPAATVSGLATNPPFATAVLTTASPMRSSDLTSEEGTQAKGLVVHGHRRKWSPPSPYPLKVGLRGMVGVLRRTANGTAVAPRNPDSLRADKIAFGLGLGSKLSSFI